MDNDRFVKGTERLIDPVTVGTIHFFQQFYGRLPRKAQRRIITRASVTTPHMGFVVEPYAFFLLYEVIDESRASELLPDGFKLAKAPAFAGDEPTCCAIVSFFRVHTSTFWGARAEFYLIAEDARTGLLSWVIVDYMSDTISYDHEHGLRAPTSQGAVVTTSADGRVVVDMASTESGAKAEFEAILAGATARSLDQRLWVEGNLSVAYGKQLSGNGADVFSLTFPPEEMACALDVPLENLSLWHMTWYVDLLASRPSKLACFPFAQHLLSDSPGSASGHASEHELIEAVRAIDFESLNTFAISSASKRQSADRRAARKALSAQD